MIIESCSLNIINNLKNQDFLVISSFLFTQAQAKETSAADGELAANIKNLQVLKEIVTETCNLALLSHAVLCCIIYCIYIFVMNATLSAFPNRLRSQLSKPKRRHS